MSLTTPNPKKTNRTRPEGSGRRAKGGRMMKFRMAGDVVELLEKMDNMTAYVEAAVREKAGLPKPDK